jgi:signal transduction histidine kinase
MKCWRRTWNDWPVTHKSLAVVALPLLLLLAALLAIYSLERQNTNAEDDVRHTLQVLSDLYEAHAMLGETAAGVRGYRLVGDQSFLTPYRDAEPRLREVLNRLSHRLRDPEQAMRFARIRPLFDEKMAGWRHMLASDLSAAEETRQLWEGKRKLDTLRSELRILISQETTHLQLRSAHAQSLRQRNLIINLCSALLCGLAAVSAVGWFASALARRLRGLAINAGRLGQGLPLLPRQPAADELGQVEQRMAQASELLAARAAETQAAHREAETANRAKTEFLSRSSHELRTPLNAILGYAQVLEMAPVTATQRSQLQQILVAGRHLLELITELLDIARIESDRLELSPQAVALGPAIEEALGLLAPDARQHGITLQAEPIATNLGVSADPQRLRQVLLNLLSNAIKFNREHGVVKIRTEQADGRVRILVSDQGPGLSAAQQARLFTPFERLGAERSTVSGTGLGLALSKRLIEAMGGRIGVDSQVGQGACFWICLEQATTTAATGSAPLPQSLPVTRTHRQILCIEDNASNQALIRTLCERRQHWQLQQVSSLAEAEAALSNDQPDLILLDLHLSDGNGEQLLARLRQNASAPPVLVISADATNATVQRLQALGVRGYLTKPLDVAEFYRNLDEVLA